MRGCPPPHEAAAARGVHGAVLVVDGHILSDNVECALQQGGGLVVTPVSLSPHFQPPFRTFFTTCNIPWAKPPNVDA